LGVKDVWQPHSDFTSTAVIKLLYITSENRCYGGSNCVYVVTEIDFTVICQVSFARSVATRREESLEQGSLGFCRE